MTRARFIAIWCAALIACTVSVGISRAQLTVTGVGGGFGAGSSQDAATTAWVNAVVAAGGAVSNTQKTRVNTLIVALKAHSLFTQLDCLWLWAGESDHFQATIDIINAGAGGKCVGVEHGNLTSTGLTAAGYVGNGTTGYFDSSFGPATGPNYTSASALMGVYVTSSRASGGAQYSGVQDTGTGFNDQLDPYTFGNSQCIINTGFVGGTVASGNGLYVETQVSGTATLYNFSTTNGTSGSIASAANASPHAPTTNFFFAAVNAAGTPSNFSTDTLAAGFLGAGLSSGNVSTLATDLNAYMTAWGQNQF